MYSIFRTPMIFILRKLGYKISRLPAVSVVPRHIGSGLLSIRHMYEILEKQINHCEDRIAFRELYSFEEVDGGVAFRLKKDEANLKTLSGLVNKYELTLRSDHKPPSRAKAFVEYDKIHYGCGENLIEGWLNVDLVDELNKPTNYMRVDLLDPHPFNDNSFGFAFSEDVLEHFDQSDSLLFLSEAYRTLRTNGILRLSFPGLEGVLKHYSPWNATIAYTGKISAYSYWDHRHFYSFEELKLVATVIGFRNIVHAEYGVSEHKELTGLDTRTVQKHTNSYLELQK